jgi:hypothetical protein
MRHTSLIALLMFLPGSWATPVTWEGVFATALDEDPAIFGYESRSAPALEDPILYVSLMAWVRPAGGTYRQEANALYFQTFTQIGLRILDVAGGVLRTLTLFGESRGFGASSFSLSTGIALTTPPHMFELFIDGRDALVDWKISLASDASRPEAYPSASVPEPATLFPVAMGAVYFFTRRRYV